MEFMQEMKGFCDKEEEEEEQEEEEEEDEVEEEVEIMGGEVPCRLPFISSSSSACASPMYRGLAPPPPPPSQHQQQRMWLGTLDAEEESAAAAAAARSYDQRAGLELGGGESSKRLEFVNLSLRNNEEAEVEVEVEVGEGGGGMSGCGGGGGGGGGEREHMFDKVVTPSDVGKLNRLVIPKQHAEKYFPLDSTASDKGLLLNFEDRDGKPWRFRYSYWNSSQSYVMTKGWSRFVKEKKLDAGDIVSFHRGLGDSGKDRLYIDWRRRPDAPDPTSLSHLHHHPFSSSSSFRWGRLYSLPQSLSSINIPPQFHDHNMHHHHHHHHLNYSTTIHPYHRTHPHHPHHLTAGVNHDHNAYYPSHQIGAVQPGGGAPPVVINSVPVVHGKTTAKRLRLFGVNMECPTPDDHAECSSSINVLPSTAIPHVTSMAAASSSSSSLSHHHCHHLPASSSLPPLQLRLCNGSPIQAAPDEFPKKGKTSLSFDLDL